MASEQSAYLSTSYQDQMERLLAAPDLDLATRRDVGESIHRVTLEPADVSYREDDADGVPVLWCLPEAGASDRALVYAHGGGFFMLSMHTDRKLAGHLATAAGVPVLVFDYRLAPEHPYPAQLDDAVTVYHWLLRQGMLPEHIALVGQSAGGNLCTTTALSLRDRGVPLPAAIMPVSPWYDMELRGASLDTADRDVLMRRAALDAMVPMFLGAASRDDPLLNPLYADLTGLPPMLLHVGEYEALLDDTRRFARRAQEAGVDVTVRIGAGMQHCYPYLAGRAPEGDEAVRFMGRWVRPRLGLPPRHQA
ncbi:alpha/beta hydrolase [Streptomyces sp. NPDC014892]|uniref:alpha/beta hydrolase n=1 Tax=Streptomyces sp. NPDC014892 TaxID=3364930 RepID=UPI0036FFA227